MLSHLLQASISAKMILINFEVYNEYGDKRKCKAVVNEGSTFHDLASKIRINPDHYKIHLMGDKQKTSWADQVLEKHQNKTFFATFYDENQTDAANNSIISEPSDLEDSNENWNPVNRKAHSSPNDLPGTNFIKLVDENSKRTSPKPDLQFEDVERSQPAYLNSVFDHEKPINTDKDDQMGPTGDAPNISQQSAIFEPLNSTFVENDESILVPKQDVSQANSFPPVIDLTESLNRLKVVCVVQIIVIFVLFICLMFSIFRPLF